MYTVFVQVFFSVTMLHFKLIFKPECIAPSAEITNLQPIIPKFLLKLMKTL